MDEIAELIGAKPDLWQLAKGDWGLALRCFFGPCLPAQYRLQGPGAWDGAPGAIRYPSMHAHIHILCRSTTCSTHWIVYCILKTTYWNILLSDRALTTACLVQREEKFGHNKEKRTRQIYFYPEQNYVQKSFALHLFSV